MRCPVMVDNSVAPELNGTFIISELSCALPFFLSNMYYIFIYISLQPELSGLGLFQLR